MQSIENRTELRGRIVSRGPHPDLPDFDLLRVTVEKAIPVEGKANLLSASVGAELAVTIRRLLLDPRAQPGSPLRILAKCTPDGAVADTYGDPRAMAIGPPGSDLSAVDGPD